MMGTLTYLFLTCSIIGIASCYIFRAPRIIPSSGIRALPRPIYRPLRQSIYPRLRPLSHRLVPSLSLGRRLPYRNLENLNLNNINSNNDNNDNRIRSFRGSRRLIRLSRPQIAPPRIRYPPGVRRLDRVIISPISRQLSTRSSRQFREQLKTRSQFRNIPDRTSKDKVLALFAVDGPKGKNVKPSRRRVIRPASKIRQRPVIKPQGFTSLPIASEVVAKAPSIQRIGLKKAQTKLLKPADSSLTSKVKAVGSQLKKAKVIKKESKAIKHTEAQIVESKIVPQKPVIVPSAILSKDASPKVDVKQDLKITDADTVNIKTGVVGKAVDKVQQVTAKKPSVLEVQKSKTGVKKTITKEVAPIVTVSKKVTPVKTVEKFGGSSIAKKETILKDGAAIIPDLKGKTAETSAKSSIKINDADTVNIKAATIASSGEITGGTKTRSIDKVVAPDAVVVDKKTVAKVDKVSTDVKKYAVAETVTLDKKKVVIDGTKGKHVTGTTLH